MTAPVRTRIFGLVLVLAVAALWGFAYWLADQSHEKYTQEPLPEGTRGAYQPVALPEDGFFVQEGTNYVIGSPAAVPDPFAVDKPGDEFRVFILGGSQAQGCPFVGSPPAPTPGDYFGIASWLQPYLQELLPQRKVKVINAALAGQDLKAAVSLLDEIAQKGQADLVVTLSGNNERGPSRARGTHRLQAETDAIVEEVTQDYRFQLSRLVEIAERSSILTYVLTVPVNLRDWVPVGPAQPDHDDILKLILEDPRAALDLLGETSTSPVRSFLAGQAYEALGSFDQAKAAYSLARDQDGTFRRARSPWNKAVLELARGSSVRPIDIEQQISKYATRGIPGFDLFVDNCHMNPRGHRIVALEIARFFGAQDLITDEVTPQSQDNANQKVTPWSEVSPSTELFQSDRLFDDERFAASALRMLEANDRKDDKSKINALVLGTLYTEAGRTEDALALFDRALSALVDPKDDGPNRIDDSENLQMPLTTLLRKKRAALVAGKPQSP